MCANPFLPTYLKFQLTFFEEKSLTSQKLRILIQDLNERGLHITLIGIIYGKEANKQSLRIFIHEYSFQHLVTNFN